MSRFLAVYEADCTPVTEGFISSIVETAKKVIQMVMKVLSRIAKLIKSALDKVFSALQRALNNVQTPKVHSTLNISMEDDWVPVKLRVFFYPMKRYGMAGNKFLRSDEFDTQDEIHDERLGYYDELVNKHRHGPTLNEVPPPVRAITDKLIASYTLATKALERKNAEFALDVNEFRSLQPIPCEINKTVFIQTNSIKTYSTWINEYKGNIKLEQKSLNKDLRWYQDTIDDINRSDELTDDVKSVFVRYIMAKINNCRLVSLYEQSKLEMLINDMAAIVKAVS